MIINLWWLACNILLFPSPARDILMFSKKDSLDVLIFTIKWEFMTAVGSKTCLIYIIESILAIQSTSNDQDL
jgi:hypothetical protein